jgi:hypothetical protein
MQILLQPNVLPVIEFELENLMTYAFVELEPVAIAGVAVAEGIERIGRVVYQGLPGRFLDGLQHGGDSLRKF